MAEQMRNTGPGARAGGGQNMACGLNPAQQFDLARGWMASNSLDLACGCLVAPVAMWCWAGRGDCFCPAVSDISYAPGQGARHSGWVSASRVDAAGRFSSDTEPASGAQVWSSGQVPGGLETG